MPPLTRNKFASWSINLRRIEFLDTPFNSIMATRFDSGRHIGFVAKSDTKLSLIEKAGAKDTKTTEKTVTE